MLIKLWENDVPGYNENFAAANPGQLKDASTLTPYVLDTGKPTSCVIVFPGGGYYVRADHEAEPIALWLNSIGLSAFVLNYRVFPYTHPSPLIDAQRAIRFVRANASKWNIDPSRIGIIGFSAGGHLASTAGTHYDSGNAASPDPVERVSCRPDAMVLCYPVITLGDFRHDGSKMALLGKDANDALIRNLSNETQVSPDTPPAFLFHTADDNVVPVENSLLFAHSMSCNKVPCELHVFPHGPHGVGLASDDTVLSQWTTLCANWLKAIGFSE